MNNENSINPLSQDFILSTLLKFAFPTIITMLFMGFYTIVDTIFVARFVNINALSAVNIVCPIINIIVGISTMIATGGSAIVSQKMGACEVQRARQDFTLIVIFNIILSLLIAVFGILLIDKIVLGLGASKILFSYCKDYLIIILIFTPASMLQVLFQNLIVAAGKPTFGLILSISAGVINILLDYVFMVCFKMGISGAALGTGIGYLVPSIIGILFFSSKIKLLIFKNMESTLYFEKPVLDISILIQSCANGSSEMVSQISTAITTFFFNLTMMKLLGESGVAAITIIIYSQFLMTTLYIGFSMGVAPIISFNYGGENFYILKKIYRLCLGFIIISSITIFLISVLCSNQLVQLFAGSSIEVYNITVRGFFIFSFSFLFSGINIFSSATFTALSNGKISALISFLRTFGFIMISLLILPIHIGVTGVWLAVPISELLTLNISLFFIFYYRKKYGYM
ncbi:MATE family efflux transporter [Intestinibacter sp.]